MRRDCGESGRNLFRPGNGGSNDDGVCADVERAAKVCRSFDSSLKHNRNRAVADQCRKQIPGHTYQAAARGSISSQRGGDRVGPGSDGLPCLRGSGDVGKYGQIELAADAPYKHRPRFAKRGLSVSAVDRDDRGSGGRHGLSSCEIGSDEDLIVVVAFADADDRLVGELAKGANTLGPLGTQAMGPAAQDAGGDPAERSGVVERIALGRLAGNDQTVTKFFWKRQAVTSTYANLLPIFTQLRL
jgi:hypothetical protein